MKTLYLVYRVFFFFFYNINNKSTQSKWKFVSNTENKIKKVKMSTLNPNVNNRCKSKPLGWTSHEIKLLAKRPFICVACILILRQLII